MAHHGPRAPPTFPFHARANGVAPWHGPRSAPRPEVRPAFDMIGKPGVSLAGPPATPTSPVSRARERPTIDLEGMRVWSEPVWRVPWCQSCRQVRGPAAPPGCIRAIQRTAASRSGLPPCARDPGHAASLGHGDRPRNGRAASCPHSPYTCPISMPSASRSWGWD
jgi:hypothetical protein